VNERIEWERALPPDLRFKAPKRLPIEIGGIYVDGRIYTGPWTPMPIIRGQGTFWDWARKPGRDGMTDPQARIVDMDREGIDVAVLFGGFAGLGAAVLPDARLGAVMARAYNDWLASYCKPHPKRLIGVAALAAQDPPEAARELRRCVQDYGFRGAAFPVNVQGKNLADPSFNPIWAEAERLDVPVCLHNSSVIHGPGGERFTSYFFKKAPLDGFENMLASMSVVCGGVLDRFPELRVAFMESGAGWVPYWLDRLDDYYSELGHRSIEYLDAPLRRGLPSAYFKSEQCYFSCEVEEKTLPYVLSVVGEDRALYASDYLHHDCKFPESVNIIKRRADLSPEAKEKVLGRNAAALYKLG
jgi:predicted TIM-barrel fold metal-dependent hydrolase